MIIEDWGLIPYREAWHRQKKLFENLVAYPDTEEYIVLCEHPAVYTLGFHGNEANMTVSTGTLREAGAELIRIERGGDITYHGPGQLVVYPIINLRRHHLGVKAYIELLEMAVEKLLLEYGIKASSNKDLIGVWVDWEETSARKICAIGVKISHGITMHGLALNVNTDLKAFSLINPCGIVDKGVTSMEFELGHPADMNEIKARLGSIIKDVLNNYRRTQ